MMRVETKQWVKYKQASYKFEWCRRIDKAMDLLQAEQDERVKRLGYEPGLASWNIARGKLEHDFKIEQADLRKDFEKKNPKYI